MLKEVSGNENIKFNPFLFITDEAGANANGITKVFGEEGNRKSRTCQFHFKQGLNRMLAKFPANSGELKTEFEQLMYTLCTISPLSEYEEVKIHLIYSQRYILRLFGLKKSAQLPEGNSF